MGMSNKKWFTLLELIIAIGLLGVGLIAVFVVLNSGFNTMRQARWQVTAINLAREWAEMMFNVRDTNLRKWSGKKDACWLNRKSVYAASDAACENEPWIGYYYSSTGISYIPVFAPFGNSQTPIVIPMTGNSLNIFDGEIANDAWYELLTTASGEFLPFPFFEWSQGLASCYTILSGELKTTDDGCIPQRLSPAGKFYRSISNVWLYDKHTSTTGGRNLQCADGSSTDSATSTACGTSIAKELRFCSEVQYIVDNARRTVTMCSVMSNFKE